ncbi:uroporphyrinogen-III C-methyltransferase [Thalassotalea aquiviva]|uniref:uroporphyrinogen-III C-methyltransferase n=1 Tax=Thalassotalea aquiviva TaxID=3242415 RepID=UPI00352AD3F1
MTAFCKMNRHTQLQPSQVAIVGAGPGDPELLTIKAYHCIRQAEVLVYDRLVSAEILALAPTDCRRIYVGKSLKNHCFSQDKINQTLVKWALKGKKVVRLKGGDSFIFGRGSEEVNHLLEHKVASIVIPGITAASGCTTYAGIPLTHRELAHSCSFITGHFSHDSPLKLPWQHYSDNLQTLVFYMGIKSASTISEQLIKHGRKPNTPVAIIYKGTQAQQKVWRTSLVNLAACIVKHEIKAPSLLVVGDVVDAINTQKLTNMASFANQSLVANSA